ncbi:MAG: hypothetical protein K6U74_17310, partial [Firmicutes bacterium]|nr:hypothetical protein [Bacillota bacterium]
SLPAPLLNRVYCIEVEPPRLEQWVRWMSVNHPGSEEKVFAYLLRFPGDFYRVPEEGEGIGGYPTPRSFTFLARDLAKARVAGLGPEAVRALCIAALGAEAGEKFYAFYQHPVPTFEELQESPSVFERMGLDERYISVVVVGQGIAAAVSALASPSTANILDARRLLRTLVFRFAPLLEVIAGQSREYVGLLWFTLANHLDAPWREALYLEICARSVALRKACAALGDLLKWPA